MSQRAALGAGLIFIFVVGLVVSLEPRLIGILGIKESGERCSMPGLSAVRFEIVDPSADIELLRPAYWTCRRAEFEAAPLPRLYVISRFYTLPAASRKRFCLPAITEIALRGVIKFEWWAHWQGVIAPFGRTGSGEKFRFTTADVVEQNISCNLVARIRALRTLQSHTPYSEFGWKAGAVVQSGGLRGTERLPKRSDKQYDAETCETSDPDSPIRHSALCKKVLLLNALAFGACYGFAVWGGGLLLWSLRALISPEANLTIRIARYSALIAGTLMLGLGLAIGAHIAS